MGKIKLIYSNQVIAIQEFDTLQRIAEITETWRKRYGKKFTECTTELIEEPKYKKLKHTPAKSVFLQKGKLAATFSRRNKPSSTDWFR